MVIWIGQQLGADSIQNVFGAPSLAQINTEMVYTYLCMHYLEVVISEVSHGIFVVYFTEVE